MGVGRRGRGGGALTSISYRKHKVPLIGLNLVIIWRRVRRLSKNPSQIPHASTESGQNDSAQDLCQRKKTEVDVLESPSLIVRRRSLWT